MRGDRRRVLGGVLGELGLALGDVDPFDEVEDFRFLGGVLWKKKNKKKMMSLKKEREREKKDRKTKLKNSKDSLRSSLCSR